MKKLVTAIFTGILFAGVAVTTASAQGHEVQRGENLWDLANEYNTTVDDLVEVNDLKTSIIQPKQILYIDENESYVVQRGDTLLAISDEYDVTVDDLKEWNELKTSLIVIGQELEIKGANIEQEDEEVQEEQTTSTKEEAPEQEEAPKSEEASSSNGQASTSESEEKPQGETFSVNATAYTAGCDGCSGVTYTGVDLNKNPNAKVIAVDPDVIPLGSEVYVEGYGYATAADIGGAIKGNKIDVHVPTKKEAYDWGVRTVDVTVVE